MVEGDVFAEYGFNVDVSTGNALSIANPSSYPNFSYEDVYGADLVTGDGAGIFGTLDGVIDIDMWGDIEATTSGVHLTAGATNPESAIFFETHGSITAINRVSTPS